MSSIKKQVEAALSVLAEARGKAPKRKTRSKSIVRLYRWSGSSTDVSWGLTSADAKKRACSQHGCEDVQQLAREYPSAIVEALDVDLTARGIVELLEDVENYVCSREQAARSLNDTIL